MTLMKQRPVSPAMLVVWICFLAFPMTARCCNVPVFRYALENWRPDFYQVVVISRGKLNEQQLQWVRQLEAIGVDPQQPANLQLHAVDLQQQSLVDALRARFSERQAPDWALQQLDGFAAEQDLDQPLMLVLYPQVWDRLAWYAELSADNVSKLIDSPLRQEIAERILGGQSAVWVLLESGDTRQDDDAWQTLQAELKRTSEVVQLPARELIEADEYYRPEVEIELRVDFSAVRLRVDDDTEQAFASLLRGSEADLREFKEPLAIPIYGRGRTHFALVGAGISRQTIEESGRFLCGACSCQVKEDNPGIDMLMAVNWAGRVQGTAMPQIVLPELTGIGGLDVAAQPATATDAARRDTSATESADTALASAGESTSAVEPPPAVESPTADIATIEPSASVSAAATEETGTDGAMSAIAKSSPTSARVPAEPSDGFQRRLLWGVAGGVVVAVALLSLMTFGLRRTL